jgi:hypothetical protein
MLTAKQHKFVEGYVTGRSASDAYRIAYDTVNMSPASMHSPKLDAHLFHLFDDGQ